MNDAAPNEFEQATASEQARGGLLRDLWGFMRENKKWWLLPILAMLLLLGWLIVVQGTWLAPFVYTLF